MPRKKPSSGGPEVIRLVRTAANPKGRRVSLRKLIEAASEEGAARALAKLGLHDDTAGKDIRELRDLLEAWRETRKTAWRTVVRWVTSALIILILAGLAIRLKLPFFNG